MKAFRFYGSKPGSRLEEVPRPARESGDALLVRVAGAGVCRTDLHILDGSFDGLIAKVPFTLGHENVGWVEEASPALGALRPGDPVILYPQVTCGLCPACRAGDDMACETGKFIGLDGTDGGFADYLTISGRCVVPLPKDEDPVRFAPLADAGLTAYHSVKSALSALNPAGTAVVIGAGGVGQMAIQLLGLMTPAEIISIDVTEARLKLSEDLGADHSVLSTGDQGQVAKEVMGLTGGKGADVVFDFVGETPTASLAQKVLVRGGLHSVVGYGGVASAPTMQLVAREIRVKGNLVGTYNELAELVKIFVRRKLTTRIERRRLGEIEGVLSSLRKNEINGRAVLVP